MLSALRVVRPLRSFRPIVQVRWNSNEVPLINPNELIAPPGAKHMEKMKKGQLRKHLDVEVNPDHGLWAFFRKKEVNGLTEYETVEPVDAVADDSGRSWKAVELRRKSFKDLHTLWHIVLRERNLLSTQREEARRIGVSNPGALACTVKMHQCRKTMARIKFVINERRLVFENHAKALEAAKAAAKTEPTAETSEKLVRPPRTRAERRKARHRAASQTPTLVLSDKSTKPSASNSLPPPSPAASSLASPSSHP